MNEYAQIDANKEIDKITEEKFENDLSDLSNKFIESFKQNNYSKNYYKFFDDLEMFKEKAYMITPDFPNKNQILFDKIFDIMRKFIVSDLHGNGNIYDSIMNYLNNIRKNISKVKVKK